MGSGGVPLLFGGLSLRRAGEDVPHTVGGDRGVSKGLSGFGISAYPNDFRGLIFPAGTDSITAMRCREISVMTKTVTVSVHKKSSRYVALDLKEPGKVIAEGRVATAVAESARKTGRLFSMMFVPEGNKTYVF